MPFRSSAWSNACCQCRHLRQSELGDEVPVMKSAMREALAPFAADGMIEDIVEARAEVFERV